MYNIWLLNFMYQVETHSNSCKSDKKGHWCLHLYTSKHPAAQIYFHAFMNLNNRFSMVPIHCRARTPTEIVFLHGTLVYKYAALNQFLWKHLQWILPHKKTLQGCKVQIVSMDVIRPYSCTASCEPRKKQNRRGWFVLGGRGGSWCESMSVFMLTLTSVTFIDFIYFKHIRRK